MHHVELIESLIHHVPKVSVHAERDQAILWFLAKFDVPAAYLLGLRWSNVDLDNATVVFEVDHATRRYVCEIGSREADLLMALSGQYASEYVFPTRSNSPLSRSHVDGIIKKLSGLMGVKISLSSLKRKSPLGPCDGMAG